jgi:hypothetical protein
MKRNSFLKRITFLLVLLCSLTMASGIMAAPVPFVFNNFENAGGLEAGEFYVTVNGQTTVSYCTTFYQYINVPGSYLADLYALSGSSQIRAAWLFDTYTTGGSNHNIDAAIQLAVWHYFGLVDFTPYKPALDALNNNATIAMWYDKFTNLASIYGYVGDTPNAFTGNNYRWADLDWTSGGTIGEYQDQLVRMPVPEPGSILLLGLGLLGIGLLRRKQ